jgi:predicted RecA/RadA family phage recombinase
MATNSIGTGELVNITAGSAISSGDPVQQGVQLFGIAIADIANGAVGVIQTDGAWTLTKNTHATTKAFAVGDDVYWDDTNSRCEVEDSSNGLIYIGTCIVAAASTATTVGVALAGPGGARVSSNVQGATVELALAPAATTIHNWTAPVDCTIQALGVSATVQPASAAGTLTIAVADALAATSLLTGATADLDGTITANTRLNLGLTATAANLNLSQGDVVSFTVVSDNLDLVGEGLIADIRYRAR